ncbi:MAG: DUF448 domain-containing protein [Desulfovibrio sp.]|nr:DUF448 domain-containing protein [Desulfovibrio sp.]
MSPSQAHAPMRTCLGCGRKAPQAELLRLVLQGGVVTPDRGRLRPGRGAYICPSRECAQRLGRGKRSHRVFKRPLPSGAWDGFFAWPEIAALP